MLKINEAILRSGLQGRRIMKKDIAARLFPGVPVTTQQVNFTNLVTGRTRRIDPEWVRIICEMCGCDPNFLFGFEKEESHE